MMSYEEGDAAGRAGRAYTENPYLPGTADYECWVNGWHHGRWVWAQSNASATETVACPTCKAEGERVFLSNHQQVWDPDGYVQPDSGRDDFDPPADGAENMTCGGCHVAFEHRRYDPYGVDSFVRDIDPLAASALATGSVRREKAGLVYVVRSAGRIRIGKASSPQRYKSYERSLPHGAELLKVWESHEPLSWEMVLHAQYREFRIHGSWYEIPEPKLQELLALQPNG